MTKNMKVECIEREDANCGGTTSYAPYIDLKMIQLELWMWRGYSRCGSDIFGGKFWSEDGRYNLTLSDGYYVVGELPQTKIGKERKVLRNFSMGNHLGDLRWVLEMGFTMKSLFTTLLDRLIEESDVYKDVIEEMMTKSHDYE